MQVNQRQKIAHCAHARLDAIIAQITIQSVRVVSTPKSRVLVCYTHAIDVSLFDLLYLCQNLSD